MTARAVIGANFGDEGKGLITDYLCSKGAGVVVRFNGGSQAGHTVVTPEGHRHVHRHFGSGTLLGVPTFLSKYFVMNPLMFFKELDELHALGVTPSVFADPQCCVSTFADMIINQRVEDARGDGRHGSCGVGINETWNRSKITKLSITMADLWSHTNRLESQIAEICEKYAVFRTGKPIDEPKMAEAFVKGCWRFAEAVHPAGIGAITKMDPVFEGAQGLLLSQDNKEFYPHVTRSYTGMRNIRKLCERASIDKIEAWYVSRTYLTRHGAGPLPGENPKMSFEDDTNLEHPYQGRIRFAPLDYAALYKRCIADYGSADLTLALTHCDQLMPDTIRAAGPRVYGPTRGDVRV